jgi:non-homologous end joining protein Ku
MTHTAPRATLKNVNITFGSLSLPVDLIPAVVSKATKSKNISLALVCPICEMPHRLKQTYTCDAGHGPFATGDADRGIEAGGELTRLTPDQVAEYRTEAETESSHLTQLHVYPCTEVESHTVSRGVTYRLRPGKGADKAYGLLLQTVSANPGTAFLCEIAIRNVTKLYRAIEDVGTITLVELARPEEVYTPPVVEVSIDERLSETANMLVSLLLEDFDPEQFSDRRAERLAQIRQTVAPLAALPTQDARSTADDLLAVLERSIAAAKAA